MKITPFKIILIGPESTGKTSLAQWLAKHYQTRWIPEHARQYIENLTRPYTRHDVLTIAKQQWKAEQELVSPTKPLVLDTDLVITKLWLLKKYGHAPAWIDWALRYNKHRKMYLLCLYDLEWEFDPVRENGGQARIQLFVDYRNELKKHGLHYKVVSGKGRQRRSCALKALHHNRLR